MTSVLPPPTTHPPASAVHRAFDILGAFAHSPSAGGVLTLSDIARRTGLPKSTVHRQLRTLVDVGAVEVVEGRYHVSLKMLSLLKTSPESVIRSEAMPHLLALHRAVGHTIHLCVLREADVVYLEKLHGPESRLFPTDVGMSLPAHCTGVGKSLLAFAPPADPPGATGAPALARLTDRSVVDPRRLRADLARVRQRGIATDVDEAVQGRSCVARPIIVGGNAVAAVSIGFETTKQPATHLIPPLVTIADSISRALGRHPSRIGQQA
ncbi:IclR family transcriptional regulator [Gordonia terrae]|uniref:IclR family transcriptional regulator n=1 Tax=Gordonia terrae TaxID=2055 RepID=UPI003F6D7507